MAHALLRVLLGRRHISSLRKVGGTKGPCTARDDGILLPFLGDPRKYRLFAPLPNVATVCITGWSGEGPPLWRLHAPSRFFGAASSDHIFPGEGAPVEDSSSVIPPQDSAESAARTSRTEKPRRKGIRKKSLVDFTKLDVELLPTVILVGRPNVGKSALFNRLIRRREALVYNTPDGHVTRDVREGIAKLGDLRFRVLDSAGLETAASSGSILNRTTELTRSVLARTQFAIFLIDVRAGLQPLDLEVGKWLRKNAPGIHTILAMNKSESLDDGGGLLIAEAAEAHALGFGDPIAISAETGLGMADLYEALCPLLEDYMLQILTGMCWMSRAWPSQELQRKEFKKTNPWRLRRINYLCSWPL
uniref:GTPase Der n=1 Tax=Anthurium amnicola TaxID=1678845 RepID=A0A1D1YWU0_9ARAE